MRIAVYVGTSVALAGSVLLRAAYERPNFYSACVYLSQSNACLMILTNLVLLLTASFMYGLQRLLYGPLRPMEVERLYEHAWFAITETLLAMTIFRDDVGVWFFVMFVSLIAGKIWQWIGAGRVEFVEQQPPASNEIFFHSRLASSLLISIVYDMTMLGYCVDTVLRQARPNMIVMFGFEYALLLIESIATFFRHILCLVDLAVQSRQTEAKRQEILEERRAERQRQREQAGEGPLPEAELAAEDIEVDDNEIDVPGWEGKGRWVFYLDLAKDFVKLTIYMAFFVILMTFHGLPIHIMRDVLLTFRSFHKRIYDFLRYRNATRDMNSRYPDATSEDLGENNICIICREEMRPWTTPEQAQAPADPTQPPRRPIDERHRAKKLPCGHCLHISCLRSWLERQQACPTCRQPVLVEETRQRQQANRANPAANGGLQPGPQQGGQNQAPQDPNGQQPPLPRMRQIQFGPFRIGYGVRAVNLNAPQQPAAAVAQALEQGRQQQQQQQSPQQQLRGQSDRSARALLREALSSPTRAETIVAQTMWLDQLERRIMTEIEALNIAQNQLHLVRALQAEYMRLRRVAAATVVHGPEPGASTNAQSALANLFTGMNTGGLNMPAGQDMQQPQLFNPVPQQPAMGYNDPNLPQGLALPPGWTMLPLQRTDGALAQGQGGSQGSYQAGASSSTDTPISTTQSATDAAASLQNWNDTMTRTLQEARSREYNPVTAPAQPQPQPTPTTTSSSTMPQLDSLTGAGNHHRVVMPQDWNARSSSVTNPASSNVASSSQPNLPSQNISSDEAGTGTDPVGGLAGTSNGAETTSSHATMGLNGASNDVAESSIQQPISTTAEPSTTDSHAMATSEEDHGKGKEPVSAGTAQPALHSGGDGTSASSVERPAQSLQPSVEEDEDDGT